MTPESIYFHPEGRPLMCFVCMAPFFYIILNNNNNNIKSSADFILPDFNSFSVLIRAGNKVF